MAVVPDVAAVREAIGAPAADISDADLGLILMSELDVQVAYLRWNLDAWPDDEIPDPVAWALVRRCARAVAARGVPLGSLPALSAGMGAQYGLPGAGLLPRYDSEIERLEAPYRVAGIA